jgi:exonuclease VII small subunit
MLSKTIYLHENQRCWIGRGFSAGGLLPNDRGPYSLRDGSKCWKTLDDALRDLLGVGWTTEITQNQNKNEESNDEGQNGFVVAKSEQADSSADGWWYARDCTPQAIHDAQTTRRGAFHWIRLRALERQVAWDPSQICTEEISSKCDHGDSKAIKELAQQLLEVIAYLAIVRDSNGQQSSDALSYEYLKEGTILHTKNELFAELRQYKPKEEDGYANLQALHSHVKQFTDEQAHSERSGLGNGLRAVLKGASYIAPFDQRHSEIPHFTKACQQVAKLFLPEAESIALATLIVKKMDGHFQLHCNHHHCGDTCHFHWEQCPNEGCPAVLSRLYLSSHDEQECQYKIISCEENCGESFPRHARAKHLAELCPLREANCPFGRIGCSTIVKAKDIPDHVDADTGSHLLLALHRMMEYEDMIRKLVSKQNQLEQENAALKQAMQKNRDFSFERIKAMDEKIATAQKQVDAVDKAQQKESKRIQSRLHQVERSHAK